MRCQDVQRAAGEPGGSKEHSGMGNGPQSLRRVEQCWLLQLLQELKGQTVMPSESLCYKDYRILLHCVRLRGMGSGCERCRAGCPHHLHQCLNRTGEMKAPGISKTVCPSRGLFLAAIVCNFPPLVLLGHSAGSAAALLGMYCFAAVAASV